eukprot:TRINITY_DN58352_c0_g1_i1.p1 TRINITY_DN58352_c0_g1~~TRINITY_DN58352_c0_g1_i1.p1  ORF type:complete len:128 (-),score=19.15 TRINITY_DN58352_c0_g1_i1:3-341(-)
MSTLLCMVFSGATILTILACQIYIQCSAEISCISYITLKYMFAGVVLLSVFSCGLVYAVLPLMSTVRLSEYFKIPLPLLGLCCIQNIVLLGFFFKEYTSTFPIIKNDYIRSN